MDNEIKKHAEAHSFIDCVEQTLKDRKANVSLYRQNGMIWEKVGELDAAKLVEYCNALIADSNKFQKQKSYLYKQLAETQTLLEYELTKNSRTA